MANHSMVDVVLDMLVVKARRVTVANGYPIGFETQAVTREHVGFDTFQYPIMVVFEPDAEEETSESGRQTRNRISWACTIFCRPGDESAQNVTTSAACVKDAIMEDPTLGGAVIMTWPDRTEYIVAVPEDGDQEVHFAQIFGHSILKHSSTNHRND